MKARNALVSNSSSTSFLVPLSEAGTTADLFAKMLPARGWDTDDNDLEALVLLTNAGMDPNLPIFFNSCNYETLIVKTSHGYIVITCNNHCWWDYVQTSHITPQAWSEATGLDFGEYDFDGHFRAIVSLSSGKKVCHICSQTWSGVGYIEQKKGWELVAVADGEINEDKICLGK